MSDIFKAYPATAVPLIEACEVILRGSSPFKPAEREMIAAYVVGIAECRYSYVAHTEVAYAWGIEDGLIDKLLDDLEAAIE